MKEIYRTYKFKIYPNKEQQVVLACYFGSVRFVYNHFLAEGLRIISVGHTDYTDGDGVRLGNEHLSAKSERSPRL